MQILTLVHLVYFVFNSLTECPVEAGAGDRDRTGDVQLGKLAFYR